MCDGIPELLIRNVKTAGTLALRGRAKPPDGEKHLVNCIHEMNEHGHSQSLTVLSCESHAVLGMPVTTEASPLEWEL